MGYFKKYSWFFTIGLLSLLGNPLRPESKTQTATPAVSSRNLQEVVSFFPFHFPMEITFAPGYQPVIPSLGTQIVFPGTVKGIQFFLGSRQESPMNLYYDPAPGLDSDSILRSQSYRNVMNNFYTSRNPGVVFLVNRNQFSFFMDLNLRMTLDLSGQAASNLLRSSIGMQYRIPSEYLASRQMNAALELSLQTIEFQPWEDKRKLDRPLQRQFFLSPGITIGSNRGWMVEGLVRMQLPSNIQEATDSTFRPEVQGRLGVKWYLPDTVKP